MLAIQLLDNFFWIDFAFGQLLHGFSLIDSLIQTLDSFGIPWRFGFLLINDQIVEISDGGLWFATTHLRFYQLFL